MALSSGVPNVKRHMPKMVGALGEEPTSTSHEIKQLSDLDNTLPSQSLIPFIFYYRCPKGQVKTEDPAAAIREGLGKALVAYYPLAGRVFEGGPNKKLMVNCNNAGVAFTEADAQSTLEEIGDEVLPTCPYVKDLLPEFDGTPSVLNTPILWIQVTRFLCGGFSLGILFNHVLVDAFGLMLFLNAFADAVNGAASTPSVSVPPVWDREILNARHPPAITSSHDEFVRAKLDTLPFHDDHDDDDDDDDDNDDDDTFTETSAFFTPKEIQALGNQIGTPQKASRFDLITACLWKCRTMALEPPPDGNVRLVVSMNARFRKGIDIPKGYYGNASGTISTTSKVSTLCGSPLGYGVNLIQQLKAKMSVEHIKSYVDYDVSEGPFVFDERPNFLVSDLTRIGFDKLDLGWGKPAYCGPPCVGPNVTWYNIFRNEDGEEDGVVVPISLPSSKLDKFHFQLKKMTRP